MSIHSVDGSKGNAALPWLDSPARTNATSASSTTEFSHLVQSFGNLLQEFRGDFDGAELAGLTSGTPAGNAPATPMQASGSVSISGRVAVEAGQAAVAAPSSPSVAATPPQSTPQTSAAANDTPAAPLAPQTPPPMVSVPGISEDNPQQMCTLSQAQSVLAAFPNATLEVWTDSGPVAASSLTGVSPDQPLPYVIAYGTNPTTGGPNLYYAGVIVSEGQQALQQTGQGLMTAGDYYVWNPTPNANGVSGVTDAGSSFAQFAQYYAQQIMAGNPVTADVYMPVA
jgi:hypothetical protein